MTNAPNIPSPTKPGRAGAKTGRICRICTLPHKLRSEIDQKLIAGGKGTDVYRWACKGFPEEMTGLSYDVFSRHRREHVKGIERAARKLSDGARAQREKIDLARAVLRDEIDPAAYFSPAQLAQDISRTERRLDGAADDAYAEKQHGALASLSGALIRSHELRAKLGGHVQDATQVNISLGLQDLHGRLDVLIGAPAHNRENTARNLLGLIQPAADPTPSRRKPIEDLDELSNPGGEPLTIDADPVDGTGHPPSPESHSSAPPGRQEAPPDDDPPSSSSLFQTEEQLGTRFR